MPEHDHLWWHYYITESGKVRDNPFYPVPAHSDDGYECACGATPPGVAP